MAKSSRYAQQIIIPQAGTMKLGSASFRVIRVSLYCGNQSFGALSSFGAVLCSYLIEVFSSHFG